MLEPTFPHNRAEFERLSRMQPRIVGASILGAFVLFMSVAIFVLTRWVEGLGLVLLAATGLAIVAVEVKKTLVFRRDLLEQRQSAGKKEAGRIVSLP